MKVIVAGMLKTGTTSMRAALIDLGYDVYDFVENFSYLGNEWEKIFLEGGNTEDFRRMFKNVDAVTGAPGCYFWDEIHRAFPEAKIILTIRDNEENWVKSLQKQIQVETAWNILILPYLSPTFRVMMYRGNLLKNIIFGSTFKGKFFGTPCHNMLLARMNYRRHNSHVLQTAPKDKLLVYNVKEGWEPLCKFLNANTPNKPFPHKNVAGDSLDTMMKSSPMLIRGQREVLFSSTLLIVLLGYSVYKVATGKAWSFIKTTLTQQRSSTLIDTFQSFMSRIFV